MKLRRRKRKRLPFSNKTPNGELKLGHENAEAPIPQQRKTKKETAKTSTTANTKKREYESTKWETQQK